MTEIQEKCLGILKEFDRVCKKAGLQYYLYVGTLLGAVRHQGFIPWDDDVDVAMMRDQYDRLRDACEKYLDKDRFVLQTIDTDPYATIGWAKLHDKHTAFIDGGRRKGAMEGIFIDIFPLDNVPDNQFVFKTRGKLINKINFIYQFRFMEHKKDASWKMKLFQSMVSLIPPFNEMKFKKKYEAYLQKYNQKKTKRVVYYSNANFFNRVTPRSCYDTVVYLPFEGEKFPAPGDWTTALTCRYGPDYMTVPPENERVPRHGAKIIDTEHSWKDYE